MRVAKWGNSLAVRLPKRWSTPLAEGRRRTRESTALGAILRSPRTSAASRRSTICARAAGSFPPTIASIARKPIRGEGVPDATSSSYAQDRARAGTSRSNLATADLQPSNRTRSRAWLIRRRRGQFVVQFRKLATQSTSRLMPRRRRRFFPLTHPSLMRLQRPAGRASAGNCRRCDRRAGKRSADENYPGRTASRATKAVPLGRGAAPPDARLIWFPLSDEFAYMTGQAINFTGGLVTLVKKSGGRC